MVASRGKVFLVGRDAKTVDLAIGEVDLAGADAGKSFPESIATDGFESISLRPPVSMYMAKEKGVFC